MKCSQDYGVAQSTPSRSHIPSLPLEENDHQLSVGCTPLCRSHDSINLHKRSPTLRMSLIIWNIKGLCSKGNWSLKRFWMKNELRFMASWKQK